MGRAFQDFESTGAAVLGFGVLGGTRHLSKVLWGQGHALNDSVKQFRTRERSTSPGKRLEHRLEKPDPCRDGHQRALFLCFAGARVGFADSLAARSCGTRSSITLAG